jgi:hypothetical protein
MQKCFLFVATPFSHSTRRQARKRNGKRAEIHGESLARDWRGFQHVSCTICTKSMLCLQFGARASPTIARCSYTMNCAENNGAHLLRGEHTLVFGCPRIALRGPLGVRPKPRSAVWFRWGTAAECIVPQHENVGPGSLVGYNDTSDRNGLCGISVKGLLAHNMMCTTDWKKSCM